MTIPVSNFSSLSDNAFNCSFVLDETILIDCPGKWTFLDQFKRLLTAGDAEITDSFILKVDSINMRTKGNFTSFFDSTRNEFYIAHYTGD